MKRILKIICYYILILVGMMQMTGYTFKQNTLKRVGRVTGASPLPLVFYQVRGYETWACDYHIQFTYDNGEKKHLKIDPEFYSKMMGNHEAHLAYSIPFARFLLTDSPFWVRPLSYGFCSNGPIAEALGLEHKIQRVDFTISSKTAGNEKTWQKTLVCPQ